MRVGSIIAWALPFVALASQRILPQRPVDVPSQSGLNKTRGALKTRALTALEWEASKIRGCNLLQAMDAPDELAASFISNRVGSAESPFQNFPDNLIAWGYSQKNSRSYFELSGPAYEDGYKGYGLDPAKELGGNRHGPNVALWYTHDQQTIQDGVTYRPTQADFKTIVNTRDGVIIGWHKYGPRYRGAQQNPPVTTIPALGSWSNIAFLAWKSQNGGSNLRYIWSAQISNSEFPGILGYALTDVGRRDQNLRWDAFDHDEECEHYDWGHRVDIPMTTDAGKAILGSPNGRGAGHLLFEHKKTFGAKTTISGVTFYCSENYHSDQPFEMNAIFHVWKGAE